MKKTSHIIRKQIVEVEMQNPPDAFQFRNRLGEVFHEKILPRLEALFDEIGTPNRTIRIDQLHIDAGTISAKNWENELAEKTVKQIRQSLLLESPVWESKVHEQRVTPVSKLQQKRDKEPEANLKGSKFEEAFFFFLESGRLPWFVDNKMQLEEAFASWLTPATAEVLKAHLISAGETALIRLIYQVDETLLDTLLSYLVVQKHPSFYRHFKEAITFLTQVLRQSGSDTAAIKTALYLPLFRWLQVAADRTDVYTFYANGFTDILQPGLVDILKDVAFRKSMVAEVNGNPLVANIAELILSKNVTLQAELRDKTIEKVPEVNEELFVENAGLVLLHPFLQPFFKEIGLLNKDIFIDEFAAMKAVLLTQYLVSGTTDFEEHQLLLNKVLCGYPINKPLIKSLEPTDLEITEANDLLQQVIQLWKQGNVQVNGTITGFQQSFLQRRGKLTQKNNDWQMRVEQKAYDIVLSSVPWGIGIVKTPWMKGMLWVDWT